MTGRGFWILLHMLFGGRQAKRNGIRPLGGFRRLTVCCLAAALLLWTAVGLALFALGNYAWKGIRQLKDPPADGGSF